jgi:uncharacterized protein (TIGR02996 family)
MSDEKALLAAIWAHPHEDTPRLVYADFLQETGEPANVARAEFIRLQIELTRLDEDDRRFRHVRAAANKLFKTWRKAWNAPLPRRVRGWPRFRGFPQPDDRGTYANDLLKMTPEEVTAAPSRGLCVLDAAERFDELLAWPLLDRLDTFYLRSAVPAGDWLARTLACPGFRNVCRISLIDCPITVPQLEALLTAWRDRRIVELQLNGSKIGDDGLRMVLDHPVLADVRELGITGIDITSAGVRLLAESRYRPPAPHLALSWNAIGDAGVAELLRWPGLERIKTLGLSHAQVGNAGAVALAGCKALRSARKLWLGNNWIGAEGAAAIATSPYLKRLTRLYLHANPLPAAAVRQLSDRFGWRVSF